MPRLKTKYPSYEALAQLAEGNLESLLKALHLAQTTVNIVDGEIMTCHVDLAALEGNERRGLLNPREPKLYKRRRWRLRTRLRNLASQRVLYATFVRNNLARLERDHSHVWRGSDEVERMRSSSFDGRIDFP